MFTFFKKSKTHEKIFAQNEYVLRLVCLLLYAGTSILRDIFHSSNYNGTSSDPATLYCELLSYQSKFLKLLNQKVINQAQYDLIYPSDGKTYSEKFDITLLVILIRYCTAVPPPRGSKKWATDPLQTNDTTLGSYIIRLQRLRNIIIHQPPPSKYEDFIYYWDEVIFLLICLGYDVSLVKDLKKGNLNSLDIFKITILQAKVSHLESCIESLGNGIDENRDNINDLDKQQSIFSNNVKIVNDTVKDISDNILQLEANQNQHEFDINSVKMKLQFVLTETQTMDEKLKNSTYKYGMCLAQTSYALQALVTTSSRMETKLNKLEKEVDNIKMYAKPEKKKETFNKRVMEASKNLKEIFVSLQQREGLKDPFSMENTEEKFFVDLVIGKACDDFNVTDRQHLINIQVNRSNSIPIEDLMEIKKDGFVILRGAAGAGKSFLTNHIKYLWSRDELWTPIKFVFHFTCRELNSSSAENLEQLLKEFYPDIFDLIKYKELQHVSSQICIVLDGIDEFIGLETFSAINSGKRMNLLPITNCIFNIITSKENILSQSHIIVSGRPESCSILANCVKTFRKKCVDILGFNAANVDRYIDTFFQGDRKQALTVKSYIRNHSNVELMTRVPVYLRILCFLCKSKEEFDLPKTVTELYVLELLLFMKEHFRGDLAELSLIQITEKGKVCNAILMLARISFKMIAENKAIFNENDKTFADSETLRVLTHTGIIRENLTLHGKNYQFFHLSMQEFLAAIHVIINGLNIGEFIYEKGNTTPELFAIKQYRSLLPIAFGLQGAEMCNPNKKYFPEILMKNLRAHYTEQCSASLSINKLLGLVIERIKSSALINEHKLFFDCYFEYHRKLDRDNYLKGLLKQGGLELYIDLKLPIHLTYLMYFLFNEIKYIRKLKIQLDNEERVFPGHHQNTTEEKEELIRKLLQIPYLELDAESLTYLCLDFFLTSTSYTMPSSSLQLNPTWLQNPPINIQLSSSLNAVEDTSINDPLNFAFLTEEIALKTLEIFITKNDIKFDPRWLQLPERLILKCGFSLETFQDTLPAWKINSTRHNKLHSLDIKMMDGENDSVKHIFALLNIFHFVTNVSINFNQRDATGILGFLSCDEFTDDIKEKIILKPGPRKLIRLTLALRTEKHVYVVEEGVIVQCHRCISGRNISSPAYIGFESSTMVEPKYDSMESLCSSVSSINADPEHDEERDDIPMINHLLTGCARRWIVRLVCGLIIILAILMAIVLWMFLFN